MPNLGQSIRSGAASSLGLSPRPATTEGCPSSSSSSAQPQLGNLRLPPAAPKRPASSLGAPRRKAASPVPPRGGSTSPRPRSRAAAAKPKSADEAKDEEDDDDETDDWIHSEYYAHAGLKKKALEALAKHNDGSVHEIAEVQKITSGSIRVGVKLEYFRDHFHLSAELKKTVEDTFMCPVGDNQIVDVAKLRSIGRGFRDPDPDSNEEGSPHEDASVREARLAKRPASQASCRTRSPFRPMTPDVHMSEVRLRAADHAATVARGRRSDFHKRLQQLERLQSKQMRHDLATRARPWFTGVTAAFVCSVLHELIAFHRHAKQKMMDQDTEDHGKKTPRPGDKTRKRHSRRTSVILQTRLLHPLFMERIFASIEKVKTKDRLEQRQVRSYKTWKSLLRVMRFIFAIGGPLRKHKSAQIIKEFVIASHQGPQGFELCRAMKRYLDKVKFLQHAMRCQMKFLRMVKGHLIKPYVWIAETTVIGVMMKCPQDYIQSQIDNYLHKSEIDRWYDEINYLRANRQKIWHKQMPIVKPQDYGTEEALVSETSMEMSTQDLAALGATSPLHRSRTGARQARIVTKKEIPENVGVVFEKLRVGNQTLHQIASTVLSSNLDAWMQSYRVYVADKAQARSEWLLWLKQIRQMSQLGYTTAFAPEPPEAIVYPEMVEQVNLRWLEKEVERAILLKAKDWMPEGGPLQLVKSLDQRR
eukprot:TRINITY_DN93823_c0_g1_i1.p1 TRINITY_DN93823_c0_g1~~TRINITY_DN93823_c0_g1_i1.p1  ORF type:complete len:701 (-),score=111.45 TRINITY_DN93823_c0_g1_i1:283-2385(-)